MPPTNPRHARHTAIVHQLRSRTWVSATSLAARFGVNARTIYRDIEELIAFGIPIESVAGRGGGFRLTTDQPLDSLLVDGDDALRLYVLGLLEQGHAHPELAGGDGNSGRNNVSASRARFLHRLAHRIYFDTTDWYWRDESSGHLATLREALLTGTAIQITVRVHHSDDHQHLIVKPYGMVWKGGEWWLVAAPPHSEPQRYQLNNIDRLTATDLKFVYPETTFNLKDWWRQALEDFGRGPNRVVIRVRPGSREEMLRLGLKPDSEVHHDPDGTTRIVLYVDRWKWLIPLVASFGSDVIIEQPPELRAALRQHHADAAAAYDTPEPDSNSSRPSDFRHDDSRLRATRGRTPGSIRDD
ncbi:helix-turn-helix transcriptional regulator [Nocardia cyriacigeorgica]|uniref:helix-turn-helix transcriptional regulator n=1 Tax=Nocardia cyriacigeorgica TaxID=135487 RepID=UPI002456EC09|nr:WYL domain-containing protein [Nocardia cyriacigeorgica]